MTVLVKREKDCDALDRIFLQLKYILGRGCVQTLALMKFFFYLLRVVPSKVLYFCPGTNRSKIVVVRLLQ